MKSGIVYKVYNNFISFTSPTFLSKVTHGLKGCFTMVVLYFRTVTPKLE